MRFLERSSDRPLRGLRSAMCERCLLLAARLLALSLRGGLSVLRR